MDYTINASIVFTEDDGEIAIVGFAEREPEFENYLQIQYGWKPDEQDRRLGMDGPYLEIKDQHWSLYHGIGSIAVTNSGVRLSLTWKAKERLEVDGDIVVIGAADHPGFGEAIKLLRRISEACGITMTG